MFLLYLVTAMKECDEFCCASDEFVCWFGCYLMHGHEELPVVAGVLTGHVLGAHLLQSVHGALLWHQLLAHRGLSGVKHTHILTLCFHVLWGVSIDMMTFILYNMYLLH